MFVAIRTTFCICSFFGIVTMFSWAYTVFFVVAFVFFLVRLLLFMWEHSVDTILFLLLSSVVVGDGVYSMCVSDAFIWLKTYFHYHTHAHFLFSFSWFGCCVCVFFSLCVIRFTSLVFSVYLFVPFGIIIGFLLWEAISMSTKHLLKHNTVMCTLGCNTVS